MEQVNVSVYKWGYTGFRLIYINFCGSLFCPPPPQYDCASAVPLSILPLDYWLIGRSVGRWIRRSVSLWVTGSICQRFVSGSDGRRYRSVGRSDGLTDAWSISRSVGQSVGWSIGRAIGCLVGWSIGQTDSQLVSLAMDDLCI